MQDATEDGVLAPAPGPAPPQPDDPEKERFKAWYRKWHAVAKGQGKDTKGSDQRWFGRVATTERETEPWRYSDYHEKIDDTVVRNWIWQQRSHRDDDELGFSLLAQVLADEITMRLCGDQAARKKLLKALPLITRPSLRRDRLRLGAVVPGTASRGTTLQRLPRYSWNTRPLVFLRGVLQLRRRLPAGSEVRKKLDEADKALRRIGVVSIMSEASLRTFDSEKDRMLKGSGLEAVRSWCAIGEWIARKEIFVWNNLDERQITGPDVLEKTEWFVFLPTLFEARVRAGLREMLNEERYEVKKPERRPLKLFPEHKAAPDVVVYLKGEEDRTPIAIYECKLYKNSKASKDNMHQVESQIAAFSSPALSPHRYGLVYGHFDGEMPDTEPNVYHIDLRGDKAHADSSFRNMIEKLSRQVVAAADERRRQLRG